MKLKFIAVILGLGGILAVAAGCGGDDDDDMGGMDMSEGMVTPVAGADLTVNLTNWAVTPSAKEINAGLLKIAAVHPESDAAHSGEGGEAHQLVISRLPEGAKAGDGKFSKFDLNLTDIKMGETKTGEANLTPGTYELACLLVENISGKSYNHYEEGMTTTLTVR